MSTTTRKTTNYKIVEIFAADKLQALFDSLAESGEVGEANKMTIFQTVIKAVL